MARIVAFLLAVVALGWALYPTPPVPPGEFLYGHCNSERCIKYYLMPDNTVQRVETCR